MKYLLSKVAVTVMVTVFFVSCFDIPEPKQELKPDVFYRRQMAMNINGKQFYGVANLDIQSQYRIKIQTTGKLDIVSFKNCHRDDVFEPHEYEFEYVYSPLRNEQEKYCPMEIVGLERKKGRHAWGFINFDNADHNLKATIRCNGVQTERLGSYACQSAAGLLQYLDFTFPVKVSPSENCPIDSLDNGKTLAIALPKEYCVYEIKDSMSDRFFRYTSLGYEQVILRED